MKKKIVMISRLAFYPIHWEAFKLVCKDNGLEGHIISTSDYDIPDVHKMLGIVDAAQEASKGFAPAICEVSKSNILKRFFIILNCLRKIKPDYIWFQNEPVNRMMLPVLCYGLFNREVKITSAVCENIFKFKSKLEEVVFRVLWKRLNCLVPTANESIKGIESAGMPKNIPNIPLTAGALPPPLNVNKMSFPSFSDNDFIVGYVGRICEEKGWKDIIRALDLLPSNIKLAVAGNGPQEKELMAFIADEKYRGRIYYSGVLPKDRLWEFYSSIDCLVLPSRTTAAWKEQFGAVLSDAMAVGKPVIGSSSGSIPEVTGNAGLIFPEGNADTLAGSILSLYKDKDLRSRLGENGRKRFYSEFELKAYAGKIAKSFGIIR